MFEEVKKSGEVGSGSAGKEPEDIFANTESVPTPGTPDVPFVPPPPSVAPVADQKSGGAWKGILIAVIVVIVISAAGGISYLLLSSSTPVTPGLDEIIEQQELLDETTPEPAPAPAPAPEPEPVVEPEPVPIRLDTDKDGLNDDVEATLGTDPNLPDTDGDGLFDYEEVNTYLTDPLNVDSDGDGFNDGDEVDNGYNPAGKGELFVVPSAS